MGKAMGVRTPREVIDQAIAENRPGEYLLYGFATTFVVVGVVLIGFGFPPHQKTCSSDAPNRDSLGVCGIAVGIEDGEDGEMATKPGGMNPDDPVSAILQIEHIIPDSIQTRFASNFVIQQTDGGFYLNFFENEIPIYSGPLENFDEFAKNLGSIKAVCVARIFLPSSRAEEFMDGFKNQFNIHIQMNELGKQPAPPKRRRP